MKLTIPEVLLLFALHDDRGTVHSVAYIGLDHALRGGVLAELKLRGYLQVRRSGEIRFHPSPPDPPPPGLLLTALQVLSSVRSPAQVQVWLEAIAIGIPDLRVRVLADLEARGILVYGARSRRGSPAPADVPVEMPPERVARREITAALDLREEVPPRQGILVALTVAVHLDGVVFEARRHEAEQLAAWVIDQDSIVRAVSAAIRRAEGDW
jgi:Golgi phosphoprotein 3 (GPP34)